jgi:hypothetical protein
MVPALALQTKQLQQKSHRLLGLCVKRAPRLDQLA